MAEITVSKKISLVTPGTTTEDTLVLGSMGQPVSVSLYIKVIAGTITFNLNGLTTDPGAIAVGAGETLLPFTMKDGIDVLSLKCAADTDNFQLGIVY